MQHVLFIWLSLACPTVSELGMLNYKTMKSIFEFIFIANNRNFRNFTLAHLFITFFKIKVSFSNSSLARLRFKCDKSQKCRHSQFVNILKVSTSRDDRWYTDNLYWKTDQGCSILTVQILSASIVSEKTVSVRCGPQSLESRAFTLRSVFGFIQYKRIS